MRAGSTVVMATTIVLLITFGLGVFCFVLLFFCFFVVVVVVVVVFFIFTSKIFLFCFL